jgi:hypothetical protein
MIIPIISLDLLPMITHSGSVTPNDDQKHPSSNRYENRYELLDLNDLRDFRRKGEPAQHQAPTKPFSTR